MRKIIFDFEGIDNHIESKSISKGVKSNSEGMYGHIDTIMKVKEGKMGLGVHAIRKESIKGKSVDEILAGICENGLDINKGSSVLATVSSLGVSSEFKNYQREALENYRLGNEMAENGVVVLVPTILEGNGEQLYVGFPGMDTSAIGNNHKTTCILDKLCCGDNDYGQIPKEFILGYFKEENGERIFKKNEKHFLEMTDEEKEIFIKSLSERLTEQQKQISQAVITGDMGRLKQLSVEMYGNENGVLGEDTTIQNAMLYLERNKTYTEQQMGDNVQSVASKPKRRILFDAYKDASVNVSSDLDGAKRSLREGIQEPEKTKRKEEI